MNHVHPLFLHPARFLDHVLQGVGTATITVNKADDLRLFPLVTLEGTGPGMERLEASRCRAFLRYLEAVDDTDSFQEQLTTEHENERPVPTRI